MLPSFLYLFLMDVVRIPNIDFATYEKGEPGFAAASLRAYIAAFQAPKHGTMTHDCIKNINKLAMSHALNMSHGVYKQQSNKFKIYFPSYNTTPTPTFFSNYSATLEGVRAFMLRWMSKRPLIHALQFVSKTDPSKSFVVDYENNHIVCKTLDPKSKHVASLESLVGDLDYECYIHSGLFFAGDSLPSDLVVIEQNMQDIFDGYHQEIAVAYTDNDKMRVIAKYVQLIAQLHPFMDGNIRTCSILLNKLLRDNGLSLSILLNPNRFDGCDLENIILMIIGGQRVYQALLVHSNPHLFQINMSEKIPTLKIIMCPGYDLNEPVLWDLFHQVVIQDTSSVKANYGSGVFSLKPTAQLQCIMSFERTHPVLTVDERYILTVMKREEYSLALRKSCVIGLSSMINFILNNIDTFLIEINQPSANGNMALDWLEVQIKNKNEVEVTELKKQLREAGALCKDDCLSEKPSA